MSPFSGDLNPILGVFLNLTELSFILPSELKFGLKNFNFFNSRNLYKPIVCIELGETPIFLLQWVNLFRLFHPKNCPIFNSLLLIISDPVKDLKIKGFELFRFFTWDNLINTLSRCKATPFWVVFSNTKIQLFPFHC